jgi:hypothetical protein
VDDVVFVLAETDHERGTEEFNDWLEQFEHNLMPSLIVTELNSDLVGKLSELVLAIAQGLGTQTSL